MDNIRKRLFQSVGYIYLILFSFGAIFPVYWLLLTSVKKARDWSSSPPILFTTDLTLDSLRKQLSDPQVLLALKNTVIVSTTSTFLAVLVGAMAAYPLARIRMAKNLNTPILMAILLTRLLPFITLIFPYFLIIRDLKLMDTLAALILTNTSMYFPFAVWLMVGFFQGIPIEMEEAAMIDGCSIWGRFMRIILPVSINGITVSAVFIFMAAWNEFLYAVTFSSSKAKTLPVIVGGFVSDKGIIWGDMTAVSAISIFPVLLIVILAQKFLVRGITVGAVK